MLARRIQGVLRQYGPVVAFFTTELLVPRRGGPQGYPQGYLGLPETPLEMKLRAQAEKAGVRTILGRLAWDLDAAGYLPGEPLAARIGSLMQDYLRERDWYSEWGSTLMSRAEQIEWNPTAVPQRVLDTTRYDGLVPWAALQISRWLRTSPSGPLLVESRGTPLHTDIDEIADWVNATHPDIMSMDVQDVAWSAEEWHEEMKRNATGRKAMPGEVVYRFPDGWTFEQLVLGAQLSAEGETMGHCVGGATYRQGVEGGAMRIFSLRDTEGVPHVTVEVGNDIAYRAHTGAPEPASGGPVYYTKQIKGRGNSQVAELSLCRRLEEAFAAADLSPDGPDWNACLAQLDAEAARVRRPNPVARSCWDAAARGVARRANPAFAPLPFHRIAPNAWAKTRYGFTHEGERYVVDFEPSRSPVPVAGRDPRWPEWIVLDAYIVAFYRARDANTRRQFAVLGTGGVVPILGTVGAVIRTFVEEQQPEAVGFTAELVEASRVRLYQRLMARLEIPGYMQSTSTGSEVAQFFLVREDVRERVAARERRYLHQREAARARNPVDWDRLDGWDQYVPSPQPPAAARMLADLRASFRSLHDRAVEACGLEPGCNEIANVIVDWARERGVRAKAVQGWFAGVEDWYHWWAVLHVGRACYIVDGTRNQFFPFTTKDPVLLVIPCKSRHAADYALAPREDG